MPVHKQFPLKLNTIMYCPLRVITKYLLKNHHNKIKQRVIMKYLTINSYEILTIAE